MRNTRWTDNDDTHGRVNVTTRRVYICVSVGQCYETPQYVGVNHRYPMTVPNFNIQLCPGRMCVSSFVDQDSRACTHSHSPGLAFCSSLATISATSVSRSRIPGDTVTTNWSSVQKVSLVRGQPGITRFAPQELHPNPRPRTREHALHQQLYDLLASCLMEKQ